MNRGFRHAELQKQFLRPRFAMRAQRGPVDELTDLRERPMRVIVNSRGAVTVRM